jgi:hypothetical protein
MVRVTLGVQRASGGGVSFNSIFLFVSRMRRRLPMLLCHREAGTVQTADAGAITSAADWREDTAASH